MTKIDNAKTIVIHSSANSLPRNKA